MEQLILTAAPDPLAMTLIALVCDSVSSQHSKRAYRRAVEEFFSWCRGSRYTAFTKASLQEYRTVLESLGLAAATVNLRICAIRKLAAEMSDNGLLPQEVASAIGKVKGAQRHGIRIGNWLTSDEAENLIASTRAAGLRGFRDHALLSVLLGAGLRRSEAAALTFAHVQQREGRWAIVDLVGKHGRVRTVPMPGWSKANLDSWAAEAALDAGFAFRPIDKSGRVASRAMSPQSIYAVVKKCAHRVDLRVAPHDLRRTFARLARKGHAALEQIQLSLGHASVTTTELYLGTRQDLNDAPCDHLGLSFEDKLAHSKAGS
jgi:site-specific recombinase XerD